jgi:hypothetical protein
MNDEQEHPWLRPLLAKRSLDGIRVLSDLIEAGLAKGECSANDVRDVAFAQPNIIGGVFATIRRFGFVPDYCGRRVSTHTKRKHRRRVGVWVLSNHSLALEAKRQMEAILLKNVPPPTESPMLPL